MAARVAFLIGNRVFRPDSGLPALRGPPNDIAALSRIFGDPERGGFIVREFLDKPHHEILPEIEQTLSHATPGDFVLVYYSGHGKLDRNGRVCLATADTREGALQATSIPARHLTDLVNQSDCDQVVLLLDCCYSGAVDDGRGDLGSEMHIIEDARGFYILTASTDQQTAKETESLADHKVMGRFTAALVEAIESGAADAERKGRILLSDLRRHLGQVVSGQTPQFFARRASGDPLISLSPATAAPLLDATILADLAAENWHRRLGAVSYLLTTMREATLPARQVARTTLEQHLSRERDIEVRKQMEDGLNLRAEIEPPPILQPKLAKKTHKRIILATSLVMLLGGLLYLGSSSLWQSSERASSLSARSSPPRALATDQGLPLSRPPSSSRPYLPNERNRTVSGPLDSLEIGRLNERNRTAKDIIDSLGR